MRISCAMVLAAALACGCREPGFTQPSVPSTSMRDINAVLADHDDRLLAIPGVVGVYVGLAKDEKTVCLKVMLAKNDPVAKQAIPREIEGYPVVIEVSGRIRPLDRNP